jgi:hypothetical protein
VEVLFCASIHILVRSSTATSVASSDCSNDGDDENINDVVSIYRVHITLHMHALVNEPRRVHLFSHR